MDGLPGIARRLSRRLIRRKGVASFRGYLPSVDSDPLPEITAALWHAVIQYASQDLPAQNWNVPSDVRRITVCDPSGMLPTENCPATVSEVFLPGHEPIQYDTLFRSVQINRENGSLATIFTPPDLLETKVIMAVPAAASEWARQAGLDTMPDTYDVIRQPQVTSRDALIATPEMFAVVRGQVTFTGSAAGDNFDRYSLQVGAGLNPQQWVMVAQDVRKQVKDGVLGVWDTTGKSGLYAVQLQVIRQNQIVDLYTIEVTVDNHPLGGDPGPAEGEQFIRRGTQLSSVSASDDLSLASVAFLSTTNPSPFAGPLRCSAGCARRARAAAPATTWQAIPKPLNLWFNNRVLPPQHRRFTTPTKPQQ
jgi:hypothetical protein